MKNFIEKHLMTLLPVVMVTAMSAGSMITSAQAETTECTEIVALPAIINVQGVYCFKQNLVTGIASGNAITINTNNVTIDMNGFKLGGSTAGAGTNARGIYAEDRKNITIKNGTIRGFNSGIFLNGASGSGHLIKHIRADGNVAKGINVYGKNNIIRENHVINTGPNDLNSSAFAIFASSASNTLIADNVISGVSETGTTFGIYIINSGSNVEIRGNSIYDLKNATNNFGILATSSTDVSIRNNRIINPAGTGATGVVVAGGSTGIGCIQNITTGYTFGTSGCDFTSGNLNY